MKGKLLLIISVAFLATACQKSVTENLQEPEPKPNPNPNPEPEIRIAKFDDGSGTEYTLKYNKAAKPDTVYFQSTDPSKPKDAITYTVFKYEAAAIIATSYREIILTGKREQTNEVIYKLNSEGQIAECPLYNPSEEVKRDTVDFYYTNGKLTGYDYRIAPYNFAWSYNEKGNVVVEKRVIEFFDHTFTSTYDVEYDSKANVWAKNKVGEMIYCLFWSKIGQETELLSQNSPIKFNGTIRRLYKSDGGLHGTSLGYTYTWTYNNAGLPTESVYTRTVNSMRYGQDGVPYVQTSTRRFTYNQ